MTGFWKERVKFPHLPVGCWSPIDVAVAKTSWVLGVQMLSILGSSYSPAWSGNTLPDPSQARHQ